MYRLESQYRLTPPSPTVKWDEYKQNFMINLLMHIKWLEHLVWSVVNIEIRKNADFILYLLKCWKDALIKNITRKSILLSISKYLVCNIHKIFFFQKKYVTFPLSDQNAYTWYERSCRNKHRSLLEVNISSTFMSQWLRPLRPSRCK